jgi:hypothetical protein
MPRLRQSTLDRLRATYARHQMILADYEDGMPIRMLVRKYKLSRHRIAEIVAFHGNRQPPHKRYTVITAPGRTASAIHFERGQTEMSAEAMSAAKGWAIVYNDRVIFETVRRTRRECIFGIHAGPRPRRRQLVGAVQPAPSLESAANRNPCNCEIAIMRVKHFSHSVIAKSPLRRARHAIAGAPDRRLFGLYRSGRLQCASDSRSCA